MSYNYLVCRYYNSFIFLSFNRYEKYIVEVFKKL